MSGRSSKGGENLGRAGAGFKDNCMCQAVIICVFSFVYGCMWQSGLGFGGALGTFLYFFMIVGCFFKKFYFNIQARWIGWGGG